MLIMPSYAEIVKQINLILWLGCVAPRIDKMTTRWNRWVLRFVIRFWLKNMVVVYGARPLRQGLTKCLCQQLKCRVQDNAPEEGERWV